MTTWGHFRRCRSRLNIPTCPLRREAPPPYKPDNGFAERCSDGSDESASTSDCLRRSAVCTEIQSLQNDDEVRRGRPIRGGQLAALGLRLADGKYRKEKLRVRQLAWKARGMPQMTSALFYQISDPGELLQSFGIGNPHKTFLDRNDAFAFPLAEQLVDSLS